MEILTYASIAILPLNDAQNRTYEVTPLTESTFKLVSLGHSLLSALFSAVLLNRISETDWDEQYLENVPGKTRVH